MIPNTHKSNTCSHMRAKRNMNQTQSNVCAHALVHSYTHGRHPDAPMHVCAEARGHPPAQLCCTPLPMYAGCRPEVLVVVLLSLAPRFLCLANISLGIFRKQNKHSEHNRIATRQLWSNESAIIYRCCKTWTHWGLSPGSSACEADVIPLHHEPNEHLTTY